MVQLFSTKLLSPAQLQAFVCAGFALEMSDFIKVVPATALTWVPQADYFLLTSQNALYALRSMPCYEQLPHRKAFCVGEKTRKLLEAEGWEVVASFDYAKQLAPYLVKHYAKSSFVFFCGEKRMDTLPTTLKANHIQLQECLTYHTQPTPIKLTKRYEGLLFFSPSAIESYLRENTLSGEKAICIGTTTQAALPEAVESYVAERPTVESVLACCKELFKNR
ncbi:uroporphyrinogen-III synthase [Capnocytophaga granulosa]|uniref:uroporphyrinogen-III synthase n=1 Tax=Capnocytophaga granulosa TaxID=45242 RepID=UPI003C784E2C